MLDDRVAGDCLKLLTLVPFSLPALLPLCVRIAVTHPSISNSRASADPSTVPSRDLPLAARRARLSSPEPMISR